MAAGIDGHATVREVRLGSIGTRRKKAPKGVFSDAAARFTATGETDEVSEARRAQGRLLSTLLAGIAQFERELIRERTGEDRKRAMAEGVKFGRKRKQSDYHRAEAVKRRAAGETLASIAKSYGVDIQHDLAAQEVTSQTEGTNRVRRASRRSACAQHVKDERRHNGPILGAPLGMYLFLLVGFSPSTPASFSRVFALRPVNKVAPGPNLVPLTGDRAAEKASRTRFGIGPHHHGRIMPRAARNHV
jgi:hypothetical protein